MAAVDTAVTAQQGAAALGPAVVRYQRLIDFDTTELAAADWFELFTLPANSLVLGGMAELVLQGTASATFDIGLAAGAELLSATALDAATGTVTAFTRTTPMVFDGTSISISINTQNAVLGKVRVTVFVGLCDALLTGAPLT